MQRSVEIVIGRLVTDDEFRAAYRRDPRAVLAGLGQLGLELTAGEQRALLDMEISLWDHVAEAIDRRLRKAQLVPGAVDPVLD